MINRNRKRAGLSDLVGSLLTLAITLVVGASVFGFVNAQSSVSSQSYGESVNTYVEQMREKFVIVNAALNYPSSNQVTIWFYNYGGLDTKIVQIYMGPSESNLESISSTSLPLDLPKGSVRSITVDYTTSVGQVYYIKAVGAKGNIQSSFQVR